MHRVTNPADPKRCRFSFPHEQCWNEATPNSKYCEVHGGNLVRSDEIRLYHLTEARYRERLAQLDEHDRTHVLLESIALVTDLIGRHFNSITDEYADLLAQHGQFNLLQLTKERLVRSAHLIEQNLGVLRSKSSVLKLGQQIIQILVEELGKIENGEDIVMAVTEQFMLAITAANNFKPIDTSKLPKLTMVPVDKGPAFLLSDVEMQGRVAELKKHERLKSLAEDIQLQIIYIQRICNAIKDNIDFERSIRPLCESFKTLERTIKTTHDVEQTLGQLLDKPTLRFLGLHIGDILADQLEGIPEYTELTDRIMGRVINTLSDENRKLEELKALPAPTKDNNATSVQSQATA